MSRLFTVVLLMMVIALVVPATLLACDGCRYSPDHWGFCKYDFMAGYAAYSCSESVINSWTGQTDCAFNSAYNSCNWNNPYATTGGGGGGGNCWMDDGSGDCLIYY